MRGDVQGRRGLMLVELLLVVAIIALVAGAYYGWGRKGPEQSEGRATTTPGQAMEAAKDAQCAENLRQLRMIMLAETDIEGNNPRKFDAEAGGSLTHCPVSGKPYQYDPETGRIWCTTPGHEKF